MAKYSQILIEGPDCSGKSTLINRLKNELCWDAKSLHHRPGNQFLRYLKEYSSQSEVIFDRGHISEAVYSTLWRGGTPFSGDELNILSGIVKLQMIAILALPKVSVLQSRYLARTYHQKINFSELETSASLFENYFDGKNIAPTIIYCSKDYGELEFVVQKVSKIIGGPT